VHFSDEGTRRVDRIQLPLASLCDDRVRDAVRAEYGYRPSRHCGKIIHKHRTSLLQIFNDVRIVDNLVEHIDGRTVRFERPLHDFDGT